MELLFAPEEVQADRELVILAVPMPAFVTLSNRIRMFFLLPSRPLEPESSRVTHPSKAKPIPPLYVHPRCAS